MTKNKPETPDKDRYVGMAWPDVVKEVADALNAFSENAPLPYAGMFTCLVLHHPETGEMRLFPVSLGVGVLESQAIVACCADMLKNRNHGLFGIPMKAQPPKPNIMVAGAPIPGNLKLTQE